MKNRLIHITATTVVGLVWFGVMSVQTGVAQVTWSPDLKLSSQTDIPSAMLTPLPDMVTAVTYTNGTADRTIKTCQDFLDSVSAGFHPKDNLVVKLTGSFVFRCYVLRDLQTASSPTSGISYHWTANSLDQLPPILIVGAKEVENAAEKAEQNGTSWQQYNSKLKITSVTNDRLLAEDENNYYVLTILARGDFNGDGVEDFAVVGSAQGKQTTWASSQYFIFSQTANGNLVRLTSDKIPYRMKVHIKTYRIGPRF